jgi:succinoglycan biosynthesis protein ExoV
MKLIYFKADKGNFGDDLNPYIFEKLFGNYNDYSDEIDLVGIGSIIDSRLENDRKKVVFGSGLRDITFKFDNTKYDFKFVRGPLSAKLLGVSDWIADSAYLLTLLRSDVKKEKKYKVSYMPYFKLVNVYNWSLFERITGIHIILPTDAVDKVIKEIQESNVLYTTAMHGAIVADIYRVPWKRIKIVHPSETSFFSEFKWLDWMLSIDILNSYTINLGINFIQKKGILSGILKYLQLIEIFVRIKKNKNFSLSSDEIIEDKKNKLKKEVEDFKTEFYNG